MVMTMVCVEKGGGRAACAGTAGVRAGADAT
jgi:hypothetical protein